MYRIKEVMQEQGVTGKELAERLWKTPQYISGIVRGADTASVEVLSKIAKALNVPLASLFSDYTSGTHVRCPKCNHEFDIDIKVKP